jgi:hypothetical protein
LVDRGDFPAGERAIERVFRPFSLDRRDPSLPFRTEFTEDCVGNFAVGLDVLLARDLVALGVVDRPGVAQQFTEDVVDEIAQDLLFLVGVDGPGGNDLSLFLQIFAPPRDVVRQAEPKEGQSNHIGAKDRLGFNGHGCDSPRSPSPVRAASDSSQHIMPPFPEWVNASCAKNKALRARHGLHRQRD